MHSPELIEFINKHKLFWWYVPEDKLNNLSLELIVEATLNYGNLQDISALFRILGEEKVADIFFEKISRQRHNFFPRTKHYFELYFKRHVPKYSDR